MIESLEKYSQFNSFDFILILSVTMATVLELFVKA